MYHGQENRFACKVPPLQGCICCIPLLHRIPCGGFSVFLRRQNAARSDGYSVKFALFAAGFLEALDPFEHFGHRLHEFGRDVVLHLAERVEAAGERDVLHYRDPLLHGRLADGLRNAVGTGDDEFFHEVLDATRIILDESRNILAPATFLVAQFKLAAEGKEAYR